MKNLRILHLLAVWAALTVSGRAQMSTFPPPPPLPQPSESAQPAVNPEPSPLAPDTSAPAKPAGNSSAAENPAPMTAATLTTMTALDDKTSLEDGDTISFRVIEDRDQPVSRVVTDTGEIDFPYIGRVKVEGKTCHQVAQEVKKLLEVDYYKQATVIVGLDVIIGQDDKTKPKDLAWVMGEVRQVGPLELMKQQPMTVSMMIMRAGGFSDYADQRKVKVIHRHSDSPSSAAELNNAKDYQVVDVKSVTDGKAVPDPVVEAGDYIIVPKKLINGF